MPQIRAYSVQDLTAIVDLEQRAFEDPWPKEAFADGMFNDSYVMLHEGTIVGYIFCYTILDECNIANIAIDPAYRRRGWGAALLSHTVAAVHAKGARFFFLEVRRSNIAAIAMYQRQGFTEVGIRPDYYRQPPEDAILMSKIFLEDE